MYFLQPQLPITVLLILGFFLTRPTDSIAQIAASGTRSAALGNAGTALTSSPWPRANPSLTAHLQRQHLELFGSRSFGMSELQLAAATYAKPSSWGTVSISARSFGFSQYRNTQVSVGYAHTLPGSTPAPAAAGLLVIYDHQSIERYSSTRAIGTVLGGSVRLSSGIVLGLQAANIHRPVDRSTNTLPQQLGLGIGYTLSTSSLLVVDIRKEVRHRVTVRTGIEIRPSEVLAVRFGIATHPRLFTAGIGISPGAVRGGVAFLYHYALGWSPAISMGTHW